MQFENIKRIKYYTMNSWNTSESLAYNLKIYNVISNDLQDAAYRLLDDFELQNEISTLLNHFAEINNYEWQAGFNGRSGGYLVLYRGGRREDGTIYTYPGRNIEADEVPTKVKKDFRQLALNIVKTAEHYARELKGPTLTEGIDTIIVKIRSIKNMKYRANVLDTLAEVDTELELLVSKVKESNTYI